MVRVLVIKQANQVDGGKHVAKELKPLARDLRGVEENPCDVPTWAIEASDHTGFHGIGLQVERHDRHRARGLKGSAQRC